MSKIKPLGKDVLLKFKTTHTEKLSEGGIYLKDNDANTEFEYYDVEAIGDDVTMVAVGDVIITSWSRITPPFKHEGEQFGVTSENEIWAVMEGV